MRFKGMNLCDFCFEPVADGMKCENCGLTHENYVADPKCLKPGINLLGKYLVGRVIGRGGMSITYLAYSAMLNKAVALKEYFPLGFVNREENEEKIVITSEENRSLFEKGAKRFFEEAKTISQFSANKNITSIYECFYANGTVYYSMEYLKGSKLKDYIRLKGGKLRESESVTIMRAVCDALVDVHGTNMLHNDISPDNIFICTNGDVKLIDFGAAKQLVKNVQEQFFPMIVNQGFTPLERYLSRGKIGAWTDIYSLGASVYYAVTGKKPTDVMNRIENPELVFDSSLNLSPQFINIIKKCMEVKAENRYQSSVQLSEELSELNVQSAIEYNVQCDKPNESTNIFSSDIFGSADVVSRRSTDYNGRCGNCHEIIGKDEYCRYCGTKKGEGKFEPYDNFIPCVYGSPDFFIHKCKKCGVEFQSSGMDVSRPEYCYKCGSRVTSEERINGFSNMKRERSSQHDNDLIKVDGPEDNVTQIKTPLDQFICFYSMFMDGYTNDGKRAGGSHELIYNNDNHTVEEVHYFYGESVEGGKKIDFSLTVPTHIKFEEDLIEYIKSEKPEWKYFLENYQPKRRTPDSPLNKQNSIFTLFKNVRNKFVVSPLAGIPANNPPENFVPEKNFMPCVYGSPEQMGGMNKKKKAQNLKKWLLGLLIASGIAVCTILLIIILFNL